MESQLGTVTSGQSTEYTVVDASGATINCATLLQAAEWLRKCAVDAVILYRGRVIMRKIISADGTIDTQSL